MKILVINPGATSTKIAVFDEEEELFKKSIDHSAEDLAPFAHVIDQVEFRKDVILKTLTEAGYKMSDFDAASGRCGMLRHIPSGTYGVTDKVIEDIVHPIGEHAANLGAYLAKELGDMAGIPAFFVDPVCVDEMNDLARVSGYKGMERQSFFHALNQKSVARKAARSLGKPYEALNLIGVHLGGGVSVAAHEKGKVVDVFNVKDDGSFGMDRAGSLPVNALIDLCFSGKTKAELKKALGSEAGVYSYLGTKDFREVEGNAFEKKDPESLLIFRALAYQLAKDIGAMGAVLRYDVDAIFLTGGMAHSERFCDEISSYVKKIAPVLIFPGEEEMRSLAEGALRVLHGEPASVY